MSIYELIAFDMDGTLLDSGKTIRSDSLHAIRDARRNGKTVALATGRSLPELDDFRDRLSDIDYFMCTSGAVIYDNKNDKVIFSRPIDRETVMLIFARIAGENVMVHIHSDLMLTQRDKQAHMSDYNMGIYRNMFDRICHTPEDLAEYCSINPVPVYKFNIYCRDTAQRDRIKTSLEDLQITMAYAETTSLECSAPGISKGSGLTMLCERLSIPVNSTIAVGDADNDLVLFKTAGLAIAMGNANENAKAYAHVTVSGNDEGGCAEAIYGYLLK